MYTSLTHEPGIEMGFCALNAMFWVATAGFAGGMYAAPAEARAMSAHGQRMAKKREQVRASPGHL